MEKNNIFLIKDFKQEHINAYHYLKHLLIIVHFQIINLILFLILHKQILVINKYKL